MDNRAHEESCIEELVEQMDLTKCLNESCDAIIFARLLSTLYLHYNIPTDSNYRVEHRSIGLFLFQGRRDLRKLWSDTSERRGAHLVKGNRCKPMLACKAKEYWIVTRRTINADSKCGQ